MSRYNLKSALITVAFFVFISTLLFMSKNDITQMKHNVSRIAQISSHTTEEPHTPVDPDPHSTWVVLFAYMRGGSSFLGRIFDSNPDVFYWYEPLSDVYNAMLGAPLMTFPYHVVYNEMNKPRMISRFERQYVTEHIGRLFSCRFDQLPLEMLISWTLVENTGAKPYMSCLRKELQRKYSLEEICQNQLKEYCTRYSSVALSKHCMEFMNLTKIYLNTDIPSKLQGLSNVQATHGVPQPPATYVQCMQGHQEAARKCIHYLYPVCQRTPTKAAKFIRTRMHVMEDLLKVHPNTYVIHQLRDPRGTLLSRAKGRRLHADSYGAEANTLCEKMLSDIQTRRKLEQKYPGVFLETRYERLADHPVDTLQAIYRHIGAEVPSSVVGWVKENTEAKKDSGIFDERRANSSLTAHLWEKTLTKEQLTSINQACADLLRETGYDLQ